MFVFLNRVFVNSSLGTCGDGDERVDFSFGGSRCLYKWLYLVVFPLWAVVGINCGNR